MNTKKIVEKLIEIHESVPNRRTKFDINNPNWYDLDWDIENYPYAFVLSCIMDRQIKAERAWQIVFKVCQEIGSFDFEDLAKLSEEEIKDIFNRKRLHRFNNMMAHYFYVAIKKIHEKYNNDAGKIWKECDSVKIVKKRFEEFAGIGPNIANMAVNALYRELKIPFKDPENIDVKVDVHVKRVLKRTGIVSINASDEEIRIKAKQLCPEFPGKLDWAAWRIGQDYCQKSQPNCSLCPLTDYCSKINFVEE